MSARSQTVAGKVVDVARWMFWDSSHWDPMCAIFVFERVVKGLTGAGAADPAQIAKGEEQIRRLGPVLDGTLRGRRWVTGDTLTTADFALGAGMVYAQQAGIPVADYPEIVRWYDVLLRLERGRLLERTERSPAWAPAAFARVVAR